MTNYEFEAWLSASMKDVEGDWRSWIISLGAVECFAETGLDDFDALALKSDAATEAFRDFALQQFEDSRDFSNSGL